MGFAEAAEAIVLAIEVVGVAVIVIGIVVALGWAGLEFVRDRKPERAYTRVRHGIGRSLMLGLDLLIASEIIRSIIADTIESVGMLGLTIVIRTFLSLALTIEIEGQLPWHRGHALVDSDE